MSRSRFRDIKRHFHLVDNESLQNSSDKLGKVRSFLETLTAKFQQFGVFAKHLSIDEQMIPYFGNHTAKMFLKGKPVRFGYKLWVLCSSGGYPFNMQVYVGKSETEYTGGLGQHVVQQMLEVVSQPLAHEVYFDNFFSSHGLFGKLRSQSIKTTGTVKQCRTGRCPLTSAAHFKKQERGTCEAFTDGKVLSLECK
jgi:DNA excision repair protein ERCC-6